VLAKRIVACLDIRAGRVVKGKQFVALRDAGDPVERALRYRDDGADEIVVLDVSATNEDRLASLQTVEQISRAVDIPVTVGGGVRTVDDFARMLEAGADKVALNTAAVATPSLISLAARRFGRQCVVLSIDARRANGRYEIAVRSATQAVAKDAVAWAAAGERLGAGEILLTSIDRDGTQAGFDLRLIETVARTVGVPVVASGGASTADSFVAGLVAGADAVLGASAFHSGALSVGAVKQRCAERGLAVRR
jgi:imidazoleglycerol phosphate synthase cyclase subunit